MYYELFKFSKDFGEKAAFLSVMGESNDQIIVESFNEALEASWWSTAPAFPPPTWKTTTVPCAWPAPTGTLRVQPLRRKPHEGVPLQRRSWCAPRPSYPLDSCAPQSSSRRSPPSWNSEPRSH
jgi:hypothetical protein